jgi:hypothetical protein
MRFDKLTTPFQTAIQDAQGAGSSDQGRARRRGRRFAGAEGQREALRSIAST